MNNLKELRKKQGLTQSDLAEMVGVSYQQIQKYERGRDAVSVGMRLKLASAMQLSISEILSDEEMILIKKLIENEISSQRDDLIAKIKDLIKPGPVESMPQEIRQVAERIQSLPPESRSIVLSATNNLIEELNKRQKL